MILTIDVGNTNVKVGIFNQSGIVKTQTFTHFSYANLKQLVKEHSIMQAISCSVTETYQFINDELSKLNNYINLNYKTKIPIKNAYKTPQTLGMDRLASIVGAAALYPQTNVLVIDAGTCIKYDFISEKGIYQGGSISPGVKMRFLAMKEFTGKLPLIEADNTAELPGSTTETAMQTGVLFGVIGEVNHFINEYSKDNTNLKVVVAGGSAPYFEHFIKKQIFAHPHIILLGLHEIIKHNAT